MGWRVSPILAALITEIRDAHPGMVIGTIGDQAHSEEPSDHNVDQWGFVCAGDFMIGSHYSRADAENDFDAITELIRAGDKRPAYAILDRRIVSSTVRPGIVRAYTGTDPHTGHMHVSVPHGPNPHPTTPWEITDMAALTPAQLQDALLDALESTRGRTLLADAILSGARNAMNEDAYGPVGARENLAGRVANIDSKIDPVAEGVARLVAQLPPPPVPVLDSDQPRG